MADDYENIVFVMYIFKSIFLAILCGLEYLETSKYRYRPNLPTVIIRELDKDLQRNQTGSLFK